MTSQKTRSIQLNLMFISFISEIFAKKRAIFLFNFHSLWLQLLALRLFEWGYSYFHELVHVHQIQQYYYKMFFRGIENLGDRNYYQKFSNECLWNKSLYLIILTVKHNCSEIEVMYWQLSIYTLQPSAELSINTFHILKEEMEREPQCPSYDKRTSYDKHV